MTPERARPVKAVDARIAVVGASGFVGQPLVATLAAAGNAVVALARHITETPSVQVRAVDVADIKSLRDALAGCETAYYLVHSLGIRGFRDHDRRLAEGFGKAAAAAGVRRIVYLGGLGRDPQSAHLASRQEVGTALASENVPVIELRAAVVLGTGSISFEMLRYLTERLPYMVCPRWVHTAIQPIALTDVIRYLVAALDVEPGIYEIGGADITTYREMITAYATVRGLHPRHIIDVPYLTPHLSSYWLDLVTPVDRRVSHALIESLVTEVVVQDHAKTDAAFGITPMGLNDALNAALTDQVLALDQDLLNSKIGLHDGIYTTRVTQPCSPDLNARLDADLDQIGGSYQWYGFPLAWKIRATLGRLIGEPWKLHRPNTIKTGEHVDWWTITQRQPGTLALRSTQWATGEGWLGYHIEDGQLVLVGALRPKGVTGFLYWKLLQPIHQQVFRGLARHRFTNAQESIQELNTCKSASLTVPSASVRTRAIASE